MTKALRSIAHALWSIHEELREIRVTLLRGEVSVNIQKGEW